MARTTSGKGIDSGVSWPQSASMYQRESFAEIMIVLHFYLSQGKKHNGSICDLCINRNSACRLRGNIDHDIMDSRHFLTFRSSMFLSFPIYECPMRPSALLDCTGYPQPLLFLVASDATSLLNQHFGRRTCSHEQSMREIEYECMYTSSLLIPPFLRTYPIFSLCHIACPHAYITTNSVIKVKHKKNIHFDSG